MKKLTFPRLVLKVLMSGLYIILIGSLNPLASQVSGTVIDTNLNEPLIGVNVTIKNSEAVGTITDVDGKYIIDASEGDILIFSYVGYSNLELEIFSETNFNISLVESSELLDEIVVVGYGAVDKKDLTGVVQKINEKDFIQGSLSSPEKLLNGKVAGLQISNNGQPGGETTLRLRGGTSLDASSKPLIVIDGVPMDSRDLASGRNPFNFVNANDVADITILKDASASAIYGSRGANGVIIITTKQGKSGKLKLNYAGNVNVSTFAGSTNILSPNNFRAAINSKAPQELEFLGDANTRWVDEILQNAQSQEHNLAISGGKGNSLFRISFGYLKSNGVLLTSSHENKSISGNLSTKFFDESLSVSFKTKTGFSNDRFAPEVMGAALAFDPTRPVLDPESEFGGYFQWDDPLATNNPVSSLLLTNHKGNTLRTLNNLNLNYKLPFLEGFSITSNLSYDYINGDKAERKDPLLKDSESFIRGGHLFKEDLRNYSTLLEHYGTYTKDLKSINSKIEVTAGHSWQDFDQENYWEEGDSISIDADGVYNYNTNIKADSFLIHNRLISFFGRTNFTFQDKYLVTASLRRDGSSRFGPNNKWGLFPAFAVGWRILEEDFASGLNNTFSNLKLRVSWGVTGNEDIDDFLFKTFYSYGTDDSRYQFGEEFVSTLRGTGVDPNIKWEETTSLNFGLDFGIWNNRISGSIDLYKKNTNDLLFTVAVPGFTNLVDRILTNIGEMENKGLEITLNTVVLDRTDWDLGFDFNVSYNQNEIKKLDNSTDPSFQGYESGNISGDVGQTIQTLTVGQSIETFLTYDHLLGTNGRPLTDTEDFNGDGLIDNLDIYRDVNGDGIINENDLILSETALPDFIFGLSTNLRFKNIDLGATIRSHIGNYVYNNIASGSGYFSKLTERQTGNIDESAFRLGFNDRQLKSNYYIEDASFLKLDNITLGYNLNGFAFFQSLRIYGTATNLLTVTGYSGLDPELPQFSEGIDNNLYPISRNFLVGLNATF